MRLADQRIATCHTRERFDHAHPICRATLSPLGRTCFVRGSVGITNQLQRAMAISGPDLEEMDLDFIARCLGTCSPVWTLQTDPCGVKTQSDSAVGLRFFMKTD